MTPAGKIDLRLAIREGREGGRAMTYEEFLATDTSPSEHGSLLHLQDAKLIRRANGGGVMTGWETTEAGAALVRTMLGSVWSLNPVTVWQVAMEAGKQG